MTPQDVALWPTLVQHMKLDTLLLLEPLIEQQGALLVLAWEAMRFNEGKLSNSEEREQAQCNTLET